MELLGAFLAGFLLASLWGRRIIHYVRLRERARSDSFANSCFAAWDYAVSLEREIGRLRAKT